MRASLDMMAHLGQTLDSERKPRKVDSAVARRAAADRAMDDSVDKVRRGKTVFAKAAERINARQQRLDKTMGAARSSFANRKRRRKRPQSSLESHGIRSDRVLVVVWTRSFVGELWLWGASSPHCACCAQLFLVYNSNSSLSVVLPGSAGARSEESEQGCPDPVAVQHGESSHGCGGNGFHSQEVGVSIYWEGEGG